MGQACYHPMLRTAVGPVHVSDFTQRLLSQASVFSKLQEVDQCCCFSSRGLSKGNPKWLLCVSIVAAHLPKKWRLVSSSSVQTGHKGSVFLLSGVRWRFNVLKLKVKAVISS